MACGSLLLILISGCGHLDSYDIGVTAGQTEFTGESTNRAATINGRVNWHFKVGK